MDFAPRKPFHVYQCAFDEFLRDLKEDSLGHACVVFLSEDLNGKCYLHVDGPEDRIDLLIELLTKVRKENAQRKG